ncbi:hypothetical protein GCM10020001_065470 [Nonomuraea salmonea]
MIVAFSITPLGVGEGVAEPVARAVKVVRESGLPNRTDAMFTTIEGEWDEVMDVVKRAVDAVAEVAPRVSLVLKADIREGVTDGMTSKTRIPGKPPHLTLGRRGQTTQTTQATARSAHFPGPAPQRPVAKPLTEVLSPALKWTAQTGDRPPCVQGRWPRPNVHISWLDRLLRPPRQPLAQGRGR